MRIFGIDITRAQNVVSGQEEKGTTGRAKRFNKQVQKNQTLFRAMQDVSKWRQAVQEAENKTYPNRTNYYRLLQDIVLDAHLSAVMLQRKNAILCRNFKVYQNGEFSEEKTELLKNQWFLKIMEGILDANYYGFTLLDLGAFDNGFKDIVTIERQYVKPEFGVVVYNTADVSGIGIDDPQYKKWSLYFTRDSFFLGDLMKACPYVLYKKNAMGFWSEHTEKFGQPLRVGKTNTSDEAMVKNMEAQLRDMGSSFWAVMDTEDNIELITANGASHELYDKIIERCNSELSKLILGQTGTTDEKSFVGSAQVHKNILNDVLEYDDKWVTFNVNEKVLPLLSLHGMDFSNCKFEFDYAETMTLKEKAEFDAKIMPFVQLDREYLEDTYGIKLSDTPMEMGGEKKSLRTSLENITNSYKKKCSKCKGEKEITNKIFFTKEEVDNLVNDIWEGTYSVYNLPQDLYNQTAKYLFNNYLKGFKYPNIEIAEQSTDWAYLKEVRENIYYFSGAKTYHYVNESEKLLREVSEAMGRNTESFKAFKEEAIRISDTFNNSYLETEYNTARNVARSAVEWARIEQVKKDLPLLTYLTTNDALVRDEHAALDEMTRPVDDNVWSTYYPPNGWNCRCTVSQHDGDYEVSDLKERELEELDEGFAVNFGKEKIAFSPDHAYFTVDKEHRDLALINFNLPVPK
jgi:SPP1 gp7 family putative phage head morphogenesis protein